MRIVCSIDESTAARDAAEIAGQLARWMRAELVYVHSVTGVSSERPGARSHRRCDLLIVGYAPRARFTSALLGEAHRRLVRDATCPIMLVPAGARAEGRCGHCPGVQPAVPLGSSRRGSGLPSCCTGLAARGHARASRRVAEPANGRAALRRGSTPHPGSGGRSREETRGRTRGTQWQSVRATGRARHESRRRRDCDRQPAGLVAKSPLSLGRGAATASRAPSGARRPPTRRTARRLIAPTSSQQSAQRSSAALNGRGPQTHWNVVLPPGVGDRGDLHGRPHVRKPSGAPTSHSMPPTRRHQRKCPEAALIQGVRPSARELLEGRPEATRASTNA